MYIEVAIKRNVCLFQGLREQQYPGQFALSYGAVRHEFRDAGGSAHGGLPRGET